MYLAKYLRSELGKLQNVSLRDLGSNKAAIISFNIDGYDSAKFVADAQETGIIVGVSTPQGTRLDAEARQLPLLVRASPHYFNNEHELNKLVAYCSSVS